MNGLAKIAAVSIAICWCILTPCLGQRPLNIYYISIGSGHYLHDLDKYTTRYTGFDDIVSAARSACTFSELMESCHTIYGSRLISNDSMLVTRKQIIDSTSNTIVHALSGVLKDKGDAVIIFYYCGHGVMADSSQDLFLIPGDFSCQDIKQYSDLERNALSLNALFTEALGQASFMLPRATESTFNKARTRLSFSLILDCCYNIGGVNNELIDNLQAFKDGSTLSSIGSIDVTNIANGLAMFLTSRVKEEYWKGIQTKFFLSTDHRGIAAAEKLVDHPILIHYAAAPGNYAKIVKDRTGDDLAGPLCYRLSKIANAEKIMTYETFTTALVSHDSLAMQKDKYLRHVLRKRMR